jgi:hypothetical protein
MVKNGFCRKDRYLHAALPRRIANRQRSNPCSGTDAPSYKRRLILSIYYEAIQTKESDARFACCRAARETERTDRCMKTADLWVDKGKERS